MLLTVILNAYVHERFVPEAVESLLIQDHLEPFEIIILSALPNFQIDPSLVQRGIKRGIELRSVTVPRGPVGLGLAIGVETARGEVIALLDEDDFWISTKVADLELAFKRPDVVYYHNAQIFVDESGSRLPWSNLHRLVRHPSSLRGEGRRIEVSTSDFSGLARVRSLEPDFNNSSIAIRRGALTQSIEILRGVTRGEDCYLFFAALNLGGIIVLTTNRLTNYRIHQGAVTAIGLQRTESASRLARYGLDVSSRLSQMVVFNEHLVRGNDVGSELLRSEIAYYTVMDLIANGSKPHGPGKDLIRDLLGGEFVRPRLRELLTIVLHCLSWVAPSAARQAVDIWRGLR